MGSECGDRVKEGKGGEERGGAEKQAARWGQSTLFKVGGDQLMCTIDQTYVFKFCPIHELQSELS